MPDERPKIRCLVIRPLGGLECYVGDLGLMLMNGERECKRCIVPLEDVQYWFDAGWAVFIDPADEAVLARWMQINSTRQPWDRK
jgi:hypothetical protein